MGSHIQLPKHLLKEHGINVNSNQAGNDEFDSYINGPDIIFENTDSVISWVLGPDNQWPAVRQQGSRPPLDTSDVN